MKRKFTILTAALALFAFLAIPTGMRGQTTVSYGWETSDDATKWTISDAIAATSGEGNTGTYAGKINTNHTYVQFNEKVYVTSFSFAFKRTSNNSNYNVYIETSTDGNTWAAVETYAMSSFSNGSYTTKTHTFDGTTEYYVRFHCYNTTAVRYVDDVAITYNTSAVTVALPTFNPEGGSYTTTQNVTISCETEGSTIYYTTNGSTPDNTSTQYDGAITVSETTTINAIAYVGNDASNVATATYTIVNLEHAGTEADPYSVADARTAIDVNLGTNGVYATGIVSAIPTEWSTQYNNITFNFVDNEGDTDFLQAYRCVSGTGVDASTVAVGDVVVVYGDLIKYGSTYEFGQGCQLVSLTHPLVPSVTVTPATINAPAGGVEGTLAIAYENIPDLVSFDYYFCEANGDELEEVIDWIYAEINEENDVYSVSYTVNPNDGEARTAYMKVYTTDVPGNVEVYAIVTINQEEYVAPSYAELPFSFNGGRADIEGTDGLTQEGLGTDYNASTNPNTQLKFDGTGDWLLLQFNERPGTLTFDIKGNSFNDGTFTVQTSEDGTTYVDLAEYTELGDVDTKTFDNLGENVRYIKWIYTNKATGNVGLGNITLAEYVEPVLVPSITIDPDFLNVDAGFHYGEDFLPFTYENIIVENAQSFGLQFYTADGEEIEMPTNWFMAMVTPQNGSDAYQVTVGTRPNDGEARSAYFKVYAYDADSTLVYSNLATVNQAAPVYDYAVLPFVWEGGSSADFAALNGVTLSGNGSDYNNNHTPYLIKFDSDGDYIMVKTNSQPGTVTIGVKMIGGGNTSMITVQGSADGETFTDIEELTISGAQNDILTLETTNVFGDNDRYVKLLFTKGSNVGVGPITITNGMTPSITLTPDTFDLDAVGPQSLNGMQVPSSRLSYHNIEITEASDFTVQFYNAEGEEQERPEWVRATAVSPLTDDSTSYQVVSLVLANDGPARSAYFKVYAFDADSIPVYSNLVTINQAGVPQPSITINPDVLNVDAGLHYADIYLPFTYENIVVENAQSFGIQFYTAEGEETGMPSNWFVAMVTTQLGGTDDEYQVTCATMVNEGEARSAYFKVYAYAADSTLVYSNLATVNQAAPVVDYAVLPFVWEGGTTSDFAALNGTSVYSVGDYGENQGVYRMKLDATGDYIMVKTDSQPGNVIIGVKMVGGSDTSTITVQASADGETFTDIEELTISGSQNDTMTLETTNAFGDNDRYVKLLFTKGSNVGVGPITITKGTAPSITLTPDTFDLDAVGPLNGMSLPTATVTYHNFEITQASDFHVQFYNAEGEEQEMPAWLLHTEVSGPITDSSSYQSIYQSISIVTTNEGPARSAYFRVYAFDADSIPVYSNLVTYNQAGALQQYTLTVEPFENLELITFVNDEMVMEADGEIQVNEGDHIMLSIVADEGYDMETLMVNGVNHVNDIADDFTYEFDMPAEAVTISATAIEHVVPTPGEWVMTSLNDLTENDVFVIVGVYDVDESSFAMPNNSTGAPSAVEVTMVGNTLSGDIDDNLKWNLSIGEDGYTFYPNGETETWLYCTNTNNGVRVGTNENNVFSMTTEGYLFNNATERYIGIYNSQDWRCYTSINNNIKEQTFAFYKRVDESEIETYTLDITGYGNNDGGYYLIASPVSMVRPTDENGILTETYDLYCFDQAQVGEEWRNYKAKKFNLISGKGYLYASQESTTLTFTGIRYNGNGEVALDYTEGASFAGWNLIGNPYSNVEATLYIRVGDVYSVADFYVMNSAGDNFELANRSIYPMEGVFVEATAANEIACFSDGWAPSIQDTKLNLRVNDENGKGDFARVRFGEGNGLEKFMLNPSNTKLYFPMDDADYAVVYTDNMGEMPLNFSAAADGDYTLSINSENIEMEYLHLIDNMTGTDVDLLATPSYSFHARVNDNAARFTLVFASLTGVDENAADQFAFFSNGSFIVSNEGNATLQVIDVMGRVLINEQINGSYNKSLNLNAGVYVLRLSKGNVVKTQKVVID